MSAKNVNSVVFCDSIFWDQNMTWNSVNPSLSECFTETVLPLIPLTILLILMPYDLIAIRYSHKRQPLIAKQWKLITHILCVISLTIISLIEIIKTLWQYFTNESKLLIFSSVFEQLIKLITYLLIITTILLFRKKGYKNSVSIPIYWLTICLTFSINLWTNCYQSDRDLFKILINSLEIYISLTALIISSLSPKVSLYESLCDYDLCPLLDYNVFSRMFYIWVNRLLIVGFRTQLENKHLLQMCPYLNSENSYKTYSNANLKYNNSRLKIQIKLLPLLWSTCYVLLMSSAFLELLLIIANFMQPYYLGKIIDFISNANYEQQWHGFYYAILFTIAVCSARLINVHSYTYNTFSCYRIKAALTSAVFGKMLELSPTARREYTAGEINNFMGVDIDEITGFVSLSLDIVIVPIYISIGIYLLWQNMGISSLTLLGVMLFLGPVTTFIMSKMDKSQTEQMKLKDKRMEQISEILNNVKLLKLFAWEKPFMERVAETRKKELIQLRALGYWSSAIDVLWVVAPMLMSGAVFTVYILSNTGLFTVKIAFVALSVFNLLNYPMAILPSIMISLVRALVSFRRLRKFLSAEELNDIHNSELDESYDRNEYPVYLKNSTFSWGLNDEPVLKDINLKVKKGSLVAIVGRVGSSKSSLFSAIMGDMYQKKGVKQVLGSISFVPQSAWIQNTSLRNNITFVSEYNRVKYEKIVDSCALKPDLEILPARDETEIGEKGINLSGGQKQRVSLARAIYQDSDLYLLDDPLSAVDAHVGQHLFERVIGPNGLLSKKTRLLATHHISFLKNVDSIVVMKSGEMVGFGTYDELTDRGLLSEDVINDKNDDEIEDEVKTDRQNSRISESDSIGSHLTVKNQLSKQFSQQSDTKSTQESDLERLEKEAKKAQLIDDEEHEYGSIKFKDYINYIKMCGIGFVTVLLIAEMLYNLSDIGGNYWLSVWTSKNETQFEESSVRNFYLSIYVSTILGQGLFIIIGTVSIYTASIRAAAKLHKDMLYSILRSPLSFFDVTPLGRIINRFSRDMASIDEEIPFNFMVCVQHLLWVPLVMALIWSINALMGIEIIFVNIVFYFIYKLYLWTSRQLKRLQSTTRSPIYSHFNESISGAVSIRAYDVKQEFIKELQTRVDINTNVTRNMFFTGQWLELWTGLIGAIITFSTAIYAVINKEDISPGLAAFVLLYSVSVVNGMAWVIRITSNLENSMVAVERVRGYTQLNSEAEWDSSEGVKPDSDWPKTGRIDFKNYTTSYRPGLDPVLKDLTLKVKSGEKVGIVGRTGAGKSSLTLALFRIIEPTNGKIIIDGIDICGIGLHDLRSKLTIIPQEPNLFAGTLRLNLDPFNQYSDEKLWTALEDSHLKDFVSALSEGLSHDISEGGDNLSAGQRQLLCLSRALLRKTKVLILDEATAACDLETDLLIQSTIKEKFSDCTVLTIAHRLHTVMDYNRIIVLKNGLIAENGSPQDLLNRIDSIFYSLAKEAAIV